MDFRCLPCCCSWAEFDGFGITTTFTACPPCTTADGYKGKNLRQTKQGIIGYALHIFSSFLSSCSAQHIMDFSIPVFSCLFVKLGQSNNVLYRIMCIQKKSQKPLDRILNFQSRLCNHLVLFVYTIAYSCHYWTFFAPSTYGFYRKLVVCCACPCLFS